MVSLLIVYGAALVGSLLIGNKTSSSWYLATKPIITPPGWVFPIVWNILFLMIALALYFVWIYARREDKKIIAFVFGLNLFLNVLWSFLFFTLESPFLAFFDIVLLWVSIIAMMVVLWKIYREATPLIVPYFLWVSFASFLNWLSIKM